MFKKLNSLLDEIIEGGIPGNDIIIYQNGDEIYRSFRGFSDREAQIPMNGNELYNIYSASKPITVTGALMLKEKGLLDLEVPLCEYITEFKEMYVKTENGATKAKNQIKIKHLFSMTAGFSYDTKCDAVLKAKKDTDGKCPTVETVKYLSQAPLLFEPGTKWQYSFCHDVLAAVVEVVSGKKFGEYIKENILDPLGMNNTTFLLDDSKLDSIAGQYMYNTATKEYENCGKQIQFYKLGSMYESGGAGGISTVTDYIKFLEAVRTHKLLTPDTVKSMQVDVLPSLDDSSAFWMSSAGYGYGLGVRTPHSTSNRTDFGWGGAAGAYMAIDYTNNMTFFYAQHVLMNPKDRRDAILTTLTKEL